jgi:hypothetical protein
MADYATLLRNHVTLTCRSVDRVFPQAYVPKLQTVGWVCQFLRWQRGYEIPSSAAFGKIGDAYVREVYRFAKVHGITVYRFAKGENKESVARPLIEAAAREGGDGKVVLIGISQEKTPVWRSCKAKGQEHLPHPHMEWGRQMAFVNRFYFYLWGATRSPETAARVVGDGRSQDVSWRQLIRPTVGAIPAPHGAWRKSDVPMVATGHQGCEAGCNGDNRRPRRPGRL